MVEGQVRARRRKDGTLEVTSHDGKKVEIGLGGHGGYVTVSGNRGAAQIGIGEYGGDIRVYGKGDSKGKAGMAV